MKTFQGCVKTWIIAYTQTNFTRLSRGCEYGTVTTRNSKQLRSIWWSLKIVSFQTFWHVRRFQRIMRQWLMVRKSKRRMDGLFIWREFSFTDCNWEMRRESQKCLEWRWWYNRRHCRAELTCLSFAVAKKLLWWKGGSFQSHNDQFWPTV